MVTIALACNAMATRFELVLHGENESFLRAVGEEALAEVQRIENQLSLFRPGSEIAQVNARAAHEPVQVSPEVFALLQHANQLSIETAGAFDITIAPLVRCWGFLDNDGRVPSDEEIAAARAVVGMDKVGLNAQERTVRFARPGVMLDLGAIGKGYALERGEEILRSAGVASALFHGGTSSVCAIGHPPEAEHWRVALPSLLNRYQGVAISDKSQLSQTPTSLLLRDEALSVSAIWGRSFNIAEKSFGHVIDSRSGQPVNRALLSAVILRSATETDALSTALLVAGSAEHARINQLRPRMRTLLVGADGVLEMLPEEYRETEA